MRNYNTILTEKLQKCQHYFPEKRIKFEHLTVEKILPSNKSLLILLQEMLLRNKGKRLKMELKNKEKRLDMQLESKQRLYKF